MTRKFFALASLIFLAGCAGAKAPPPATTAPIVPIPQAPPQGEPNLFAGISGDRLRALLGSPAFIRKDSAAEMWRYDTKDCHVFFFVYGAGAQSQVRHIETTPQGKTSAADPACLNALRKKP